MSFSSEVKESLAQKRRKKDRNAEAYILGLIGFGAELRADCVRFNTKNQTVCECIWQDLLDYFDINSDVKYGLTSRIEITDDKDSIMSMISSVVDEGIEDSIDTFLSDDWSRQAFCIGAFMSGGSVSDPERSYHLEFDTRYKEFSEILFKVLSDLGANVKITKRKGHYIVYVIEYDSIVLVLNAMGATSAVMQLYEIQAEKEVRADLNRITNFETANVSKITKASVRQRQAIEKIIECGRFEGLEEPLQQMARVRLENPDTSLKELGELMNPKLGKSGVNHRLERLIQIADEL